MRNEKDAAEHPSLLHLIYYILVCGWESDNYGLEWITQTAKMRKGINKASPID
ncbi:hypothetical protein HHL23_13340 [Chryseobacterium sp. RP-3-3]|uniref:Uncharacterized protein n=1 Tax=Chryseobacterium antibioticum TaxID=2728847 RepID=A0A7Y0FSL2_9FLAO|nr:hypothetical protein [Chryseobacterium antibioticum]NML70771.1 hypothetical protein [Chryseobacterium antibioticum]